MKNKNLKRINFKMKKEGKWRIRNETKIKWNKNKRMIEREIKKTEWKLKRANKVWISEEENHEVTSKKKKKNE